MRVGRLLEISRRSLRVFAADPSLSLTLQPLMAAVPSESVSTCTRPEVFLLISVFYCLTARLLVTFSGLGERVNEPGSSGLFLFSSN